MAWVKMISENDAKGLVKQVYERRRVGSVVSEVVKIFSLHPQLMDVRARFARCMTFGGSGLGRYREELISVAISAACRCRF